MTTMSAPQAGLLNTTQVATFNELLAVGGERPYAPAGLVESLTAELVDGTKDAISTWTEPRLWLSKAMVFGIERCEGGYLEDRRNPPPSTMFPAVAVGLVAHRAIQLAYTHPGRDMADYIRHAVAGSRAEEKFELFWSTADLSTQSDVMTQATSRLTGYLDSWPALEPAWTPRFEEPIQAKVGALTLSGRVDLLLGRPRADGRMTMLIADWKSGALKDEHRDEAAFYALVATLRQGIPPFRSTVYSLASGTWTEPDVTADMLHRSARQVVSSVQAIVEVMTEQRPPRSFCGAPWCGYCSAHAITTPVRPSEEAPVEERAA